MQHLTNTIIRGGHNKLYIGIYSRALHIVSSSLSPLSIIAINQRKMRAISRATWAHCSHFCHADITSLPLEAPPLCLSLFCSTPTHLIPILWGNDIEEVNARQRRLIQLCVHNCAFVCVCVFVPESLSWQKCSHFFWILSRLLYVE